MMKRFFKFLILSLFSLFGLFSFGYCFDIVSVDFDSRCDDCVHIFTGYDMVCVQNLSCGDGIVAFNFNHTNQASSLLRYADIGDNYGYCGKGDTIYYSVFANCDYRITGIKNMNYTNEECQEEYSLMPISSCNSDFCELNNLCPVFTGNTGSNWSALFINDIEHVGAGLINITIPQEIEWDYIYTGNGDEFDLDVKGYNVDSDYIEGIINNQTTLPNKVDFNNTITGLLPLFIPGLVIILFIYFIFRFLKKVF